MNPHEPPHNPPAGPSPRYLLLTAVAQSAGLLVQAAAAGLLLASVPEGRTAHEALAGLVLLLVTLHLAATVVAWRRGAVPLRTVLHSTPMLLFTILQAALGFTHVRELHVPLGVLMFGASILTLTRIRGEKAGAVA